MGDVTHVLQLVINGAASGCIYGVIALGFVLIYKATEMINFAQGDLMMLGGFAAFSLIAGFGMNYWLGALLAVGAGAVASGSTIAMIFGFLALILASVNIFGGFLVTSRMLAMYKKKGK